MRAILLASATLTSIGGLRASILASHDPGAAPLRARHTTSLLAPMIRSRRRDRSPIFVVEPRRCLPPVECCRGTSPSHAAKSRPRLKVSGDGASATSALAISGPIPGIVINRRAVSSSRARRTICASSARIWSFNCDKVAVRNRRAVRAVSGSAFADPRPSRTVSDRSPSPAVPPRRILPDGHAAH